MPKTSAERNPSMHYRLALLLAGLAIAQFAMVDAAETATDLLALKVFDPGDAAGTAPVPSRSRFVVSVMDRNWFDGQRSRNVPVRIYVPSDSSEAFPVIIFSTGLGRSRDDCAYLGRYWASCGYVSVHVQHKGSDEEVRQGSIRPRKELQRAFYAPENIRNRPLDIVFVIDQLEKAQRQAAGFSSQCDLNRIGVAGHDFGAQTVLALAGEVLPGRVTFRDSRVKAVVAMSSPVPLGQVPLSLAFGDIQLPCLHITGTEDNSIVATTTAEQRRLPFDYTSGGDQYLVTLLGADHMTYSGHVRAGNSARDAMYQQMIAECSAVFWDAYLKDNASARTWLAGDGLKEHLGTVGRVERKLGP